MRPAAIERLEESVQISRTVHGGHYFGFYREVAFQMITQKGKRNPELWVDHATEGWVKQLELGRPSQRTNKQNLNLVMSAIDQMTE